MGRVLDVIEAGGEGWDAEAIDLCRCLDEVELLEARRTVRARKDELDSSKLKRFIAGTSEMLREIRTRREPIYYVANWEDMSLSERHYMFRLLGKMIFDERGRWDEALAAVDPARLNHLAACIVKAYLSGGGETIVKKTDAGGCLERLSRGVEGVEPMPQPTALCEIPASHDPFFAAQNLLI